MDKEFEDKKDTLELEFLEKQEALLVDQTTLELKLAMLKQTHAAAIEALRKEKEIAEDPTQYKLPLTDDEIHDIEYLNGIKSKMRFPAVIGKVI